MRVSIFKNLKELLVQTVSLVRNDEDLDNLYLFRCPYCSTGVAQIQGLVAKISAGNEPGEEVAVLHECPKCKRIYTFQTLAYLNKKYAKITLISIPKTIGIFYCWICREQLLQFMEDKVVKLPEFEIKKIPFAMNCINPRCVARYRIADIV